MSQDLTKIVSIVSGESACSRSHLKEDIRLGIAMGIRSAMINPYHWREDFTLQNAPKTHKYTRLAANTLGLGLAAIAADYFLEGNYDGVVCTSAIIYAGTNTLAACMIVYDRINDLRTDFGTRER